MMMFTGGDIISMVRTLHYWKCSFKLSNGIKCNLKFMYNIFRFRSATHFDVMGTHSFNVVMGWIAHGLQSNLDSYIFLHI